MVRASDRRDQQDDDEDDDHGVTTDMSCETTKDDKSLDPAEERKQL